MSKKVKLLNGDNIELLKTLPENSIDSIVTDPPYGLSFMGKKWDYDVPSVDFWKEVYRVLKPGGHVLSFGGTRTYHRMTVNIEDAGFEIRDQIQWLYGSGFPKSHNISKAINKSEGVEFYTKPAEGVGFMNAEGEGGYNVTMNQMIQSGEDTENANKWKGWGTALKPANEPICVARKPLSEKTIAENVIKWGTGGINIDGCKIGSEVRTTPVGSNDERDDETLFGLNSTIHHKREETTEGRFPANIILDEEAGRVLDEQSGPTSQGHWSKGKTTGFGEFGGGKTTYEGVGPKDKNKDKGGASRFFYCPKVSKKERNAGCDDLEEVQMDESRKEGNPGGDNPRNRGVNKVKNNHPTVKPIDLMAYLCRLITPPNGIVLDPFMGSGSTGIAALREGFRFCGMEQDKNYFEIAEKRIQWGETTYTETH